MWRIRGRWSVSGMDLPAGSIAKVRSTGGVCQQRSDAPGALQGPALSPRRVALGSLGAMPPFREEDPVRSPPVLCVLPSFPQGAVAAAFKTPE